MNKTLLTMACVAILGLSACMETSQTMGTKSDAAPFTGTGAAPAAFVNGGWKAGDKTSWERQLNARAQYGQNDHTRSP